MLLWNVLGGIFHVLALKMQAEHSGDDSDGDNGRAMAAADSQSKIRHKGPNWRDEEMLLLVTAGTKNNRGAENKKEDIYAMIGQKWLHECDQRGSKGAKLIKKGKREKSRGPFPYSHAIFQRIHDHLLVHQHVLEYSSHSTHPCRRRVN